MITEKKAYELGKDSIVNGANTNNSNYAIFTNQTNKIAWEKGRTDAIVEKNKDD